MKNASIIQKLNLEQKCALLSGATTFGTRALPKNNIPSITLSDGPNGVRKQAGAADHLGLNPSVPAPASPGSHCGVQLGPRLGRGDRPGHGREAAAQERCRAAGAGSEHQAQPPLRPQL